MTNEEERTGERRPTLQQGSSGPEVRRLQRILVMMKNLEAKDIDGVFGPRTERAVRDVQRGAHIDVDGVVGPRTWRVLPPAPHTPRLNRGDSGDSVSALQRGLRRYGGPGNPTDPGQIDGDFGARTESAVRAYQSDRGLGNDGIVGDLTWWTAAGAAGATLASLAGLTTV
jgi:peptidoglycan hydrolase-like protein with peptidoglycan-binding domain